MTQGMAGSEYKLVSLHEAKRVHRQLRFILIQFSQLQRFIPLGWLSPLLEVRCFRGRAPHLRRGARGDARCASRFATRLRRLMQRNAKLNVASSLLQLQSLHRQFHILHTSRTQPGDWGAHRAPSWPARKGRGSPQGYLARRLSVSTVTPVL